MSPAHRCRGFTLLELLVVLVLIGIIISFAVLSVGDGGRQANLQQEAQRLQAILSLAGEEAVLRSQEFGVVVRPEGYSIVAYDGEAWQAIGDDEMYREHALLSGAELTLYMDGLQVSLEPLSSREEDLIKPQVLLFSSGERTPFELVLAYRDGPPLAYRLSAPVLGPLQLEKVEAAG
jgi:general secretion pathway protein H